MTFTAFELYLFYVGVLVWPLTLLAAAAFAYAGYRSIRKVWKIVFFSISTIFALTLLRSAIMIFFGR